MKIDNNIYNRYLNLEDRLFPYLLYIGIFIGVYFAYEQFIFNKNLWNDEAALALNIINRSFRELLQPLDYSQVAPIGFLYLEKLAVLISKENEYLIRVVPFIAYLLSIVMAYFVSFRLTDNKILSLFAATLVANNNTLSWYSSEVKQYSLDILMTYILVYLTISKSFFKTKYTIFYGVVGSIIIWFSNASIVILAASALYLTIKEIYKKQNYKIVYIFILWGASFIVYYLLFIHNHPSTPFMREYWKFSFLPIDGSLAEIIHFLSIKLNRTLMEATRADVNIYLLYFVYFVYFFGVVYAILIKNYKIVYFVFMPLLIHISISALKLYPFDTRLVLYLLSLLVIFYAFSLYSIYLSLSKVIKIPKILLLIPLSLLTIDLKSHIPHGVINIKEPMKIVLEKIKPTDELYLYNMAQLVYRYYVDSNIVPIDHQVTWGTISRNHNERYNEEMLKLKDKSWLLFGHVFYDEEDYMISFITNRGAKVIEKHIFANSSLYYVDTSSMDRIISYPYYLNNFYGWERGVIGGHGWSSGDTDFVLPNSYQKDHRYRISFTIAALVDRNISIRIYDKVIKNFSLSAGEKKKLDLNITLKPGFSKMTIATDKPAFRYGADTRKFTFSIDNLKYREINSTKNSIKGER